ncbi:hypothetical protein HYS72_01555 [Candidatus Pacearchaeota archaeon]|nr:hypothetical protein [Candidatus Pacearchaeota archaeon]
MKNKIKKLVIFGISQSQNRKVYKTKIFSNFNMFPVIPCGSLDAFYSDFGGVLNE